MIERDIAMMLKGVVQHTDEETIREHWEKARRENRPLRVKLGLDPSAPDIHLGHSVVLRKMKQLQDMGCTIVIIIGDYTGMIGDPTGKSKTRKALTREEVLINAQTYQDQIYKIIDRDKTEVRYNSEWLGQLDFSSVMQLASKMTVARILERDDFANRFASNQPISMHELFYPLMQAYDSVAIAADIELGGTDQIFNVLMGRKIQREFGQEPQIVMFMPLLEGTDGVEKMSKSLGNYIGIDEDAPVMFEKVMKIPDALIVKYFELCTDVHPDEIVQIQCDLDEGVNPRDVKMVLARNITRLYHSEAASIRAEEHFRKAFQQSTAPEDIPVLHVQNDHEIGVGEQMITQLVNGGFFASKSEIRRLFRQKAVSINEEKVEDARDIIGIAEGDTLRIGKGKYFRIRVG